MNAGDDRRPPEGGGTKEISDVVADNLKRHRAERGLSLSDLSTRSGVSRAMIHQIERRQSAPTINVVWKLATALDLPFSGLLEHPTDKGPRILRADKSWSLRSDDGRFVSRALFPLDEPRTAELYELTLLPGAEEIAEPHAEGTRENIAVAEGRLRLQVDGDSLELGPGDAIVFTADVPHAYANPFSEDTRAYLVMTYADRN